MLFRSLISEKGIDLTATVTTPENIQFEYRLAGPLRRLPAFIADFLIRICVLFAAAWTLLLFGSFVAPVRSTGTLFVASMIILFFMLDWFYGVFFEVFWNGKTPGKYFNRLQVISTNGRPIDATQATVRNFLRFGDFAPFASLQMLNSDFPPAYIFPTGLVALGCMMMTNRFQRLGDLAAGTMVVIDDRNWVPPKIRLDDPAIRKLESEIDPSFRSSRTLLRTIAMYVERRSRIPAQRRRELAGIVAKELFSRAGVPENTNPDLLLCALYVREFEAISKQTERAMNPRIEKGATP